MNSQTFIHPTAIVEDGARLGAGVFVGPYSLVGKNVVLGDRVVVKSHSVIVGRTKLGAESVVWPFTSIGTDPQDLKFRGEETELICGVKNVFREYSNVSIGTEGGGSKTILGDGNLLMAGVHIAHDCIVGSHCIFANNVSIAGHCEIGDRSVIGGHAAIHQFCKLGDLVMVSGGSMVVNDIPPFITVQGDRAEPAGLNLLGLKRAGMDTATIQMIKQMYRILYRSDLSLEAAIQTIELEVTPSSHKDSFLAFVKSSTRGVR